MDQPDSAQSPAHIHVRTEWLIAVSLGVAAAISRIPFLEPGPFYTDSFNILRGITKTGVAHPPGYIGYVMAARVMGWVLLSPHAGILAFNLITTFIIAVTLYLFGRRFSGATPTSSALMTILFLANPFSFYYGEVSLSFIAEGMTALVTAILCWESLCGKRYAVYASAAALALGASIRQTLLVFMLPLWVGVHLFAYWPRALGGPGRTGDDLNRMSFTGNGRSLKPLMLGILLMIPLVLLWMIPTFILYRAQGGYSEEMRRQMAEAVWANSIFVKGLLGPVKNGAKLFFSIAWGMNAIIFLYFLKDARIYFRKLLAGERRSLTFLALWLLPPLIFYTLIFMGPPGYLFVFLPALYLPLAGLLEGRATRIAIVAAIFSAILFLFLKPLPDNVRRNRLANVIIFKYNATGIKAQDSRNLQNIDSILPRDYKNRSGFYLK